MSPMMMKKHQTIDEYIQDFPPELQKTLQKIRQTIQAAAPEATEAIRYGLPTFRLHNKNLIHFGGYKNHIGVYPAPSGIEEFKSELTKYQTGKGTLSFQLDQPFPFELLTRIVKFRAGADSQ